jgi:hypothetical protein
VNNIKVLQISRGRENSAHVTVSGALFKQVIVLIIVSSNIDLFLMDNLCIICLNSLPSKEVPNVNAISPDVQTDAAPRETIEATPPSKADVAHLQNCRHTFHDHCLTIWIEVTPPFSSDAEVKVANTCPACRANFNQVDISDSIEGNYPLWTIY